MKTILFLFAALALLVSTAVGQLATNDVATLTNNVKLVWGTNQAAQVTALWNEDYRVRLAAYQALTNATPSYATNAAPSRGFLSVWAQTWTANIMAEQLMHADAQRQVRANQAMATAYKQAADLFALAWPDMTPAQRATQSNLWWTTWQSNQ
jgi:hypothetical protein